MSTGGRAGRQSLRTSRGVCSSRTQVRHHPTPARSAVPVAAPRGLLRSSSAAETSRYRLDGANKPTITCLLPQRFQGPSHHLSPFTLLLIAHLITTKLTVIAGVCCGVAEKRIRNTYRFSQHKCVIVCSWFYEARSRRAAFIASCGAKCRGIVRCLSSQVSTQAAVLVSNRCEQRHYFMVEGGTDVGIS